MFGVKILSRKIRFLSSMRGSMSLQVMSVTVIVFGFVSVSWDLSRYFVAKNAVQAASEASARCLLSGGGACEDSGALREADSTLPWYGYPAENEIEVSLYTKSLEVSIQGGAYQAEIPVYLQNRERRNLELTKSIVPVTSYLGVLSSWAILRADIGISLRNIDSGEELVCVARDRVEVPWGIDFSLAETYFDERWCADIDFREVVESDPNCASLGDFSRYEVSPRSEWGASACRLMLAGGPESIAATNRVENPWLLLSGEAVCDDELAGYQEASVLATSPIFSIPSSAPWGTSLPGERGRPYPISFERQYIKLEVPSCDPVSTLAELNASYLLRGGDEAERLRLLENFSEELGLEESLEGILNNSNGFFSSSSSSTQIFSSLYSWTYLIWHRVLGIDAERTITLSRKICEWLPLS